MKVLLISLNASYVHASPAPFCLLAGIRARGKKVCDAEILEGTVNEAEGGQIAKILLKNPDVVCFSASIWNIRRVLSLAEAVRKERTGVRILLGGPEVGYRGEAFLRSAPFVDAVLEGEGEGVLPAVLDRLADGGSIAGMPGVTAREKSGILYTPPPPPLPIPPSPLDVGYVEALGGRIAYYESARGCPFRCAFCLSGQCGSVRFFPEERTVRDLIRLASSGSKTVKLVDRTFNADRRRADRIFSRLIAGYGVEYPTGVTFHFELEGDLLDEETLSILEKAPPGLFQFELGLQSTDPAVLSAVSRNPDPAPVLSAAARLLAAGNCHLHLDLLAGLPMETEESFRFSFESAYALRPNMLQIGFLKLLSGSEMALRRDRFPAEYRKEAPYEVICTPWISENELQALHRFEAAFDRLVNSGRHRRTVEYLLSNAGLAPYDFFAFVGNQIAQSPVLGPDLLSERVYHLFRDKVNHDLLLDAMLLDRLATNPDKHLPHFLRRDDPRLYALARSVPGSDRRTAVLLSDGRIALAVYRDRNPVTGEYPVSVSTPL